MRFWIAALSVAAFLVSGSAAFADKRVAFVVGNSAYKNVPLLPNPASDAKAMAQVLRNVGFEVVEGTNLTRDKMADKLLEFGRRAQGADVAVFFYAGHGIALDGVNYLLPVDADLKSPADVKLGAPINVDAALEQTMGDAKVRLVFLDACRDNPFAAKVQAAKTTRGVTVASGLAEMKPSEGSLIAFATGPNQTALDGDVGGHSPFTRALITNITQPGLEIQQAMTRVRAQVNDETGKAQLPWDHTSLTGEVYLNPAVAPSDKAAAAPSSAPAPTVVASASPTDNVEIEFWRSVKDSNKPEELQAYLAKYPNGIFAPLAQARVQQLQNGPSTTTRNLTSALDPAIFTDEANQSSEDLIGLDSNGRRDVQRRLTGLGFEIKASGKFDEQTRSVIKRWQAARGYPASGYLNKMQHQALLAAIVSTRIASSDDDSDSLSDHRRGGGGGGGGGGRRYYRGGGGGGPGGFFGGVVRGLFH
jgi:uncharacterized caspase-like protein